ncbi:hypothetical protein [Streptomyces cacaoi]|uniref:hypothetical protein n=1 Tax=Streptomyces cacaoi TaxID=1898 RepID=UPI0011F20E36|nr:hypothetical protein [Streptomyces cacaoi]
MSLTYREVLDGDLSTLLDAAADWKRMGRKFGELKSDYNKHVKGAMANGWTGIAADMAQDSARDTNHEFTAAERSAKAIGALLEQAHDELSRLKQKVKETRSEAVDAKMYVDEDGVCTYDESRISAKTKEALAHDPVERQKTEQHWTQKIANAVKAVAEADRNYKLIIQEAAKDKDGKGLDGGFNGKAIGDVEKYSGVRAADLAKKIDAGKESEGERKEFEFLVRRNSDDRDFSRTMLNGLGPDGTISLANEFNDRAYGGDSSDKSRYLGMEKYLANSVATATSVRMHKKKVNGKVVTYPDKGDKAFYDQWREKLKKAGVKKYDMDVVEDSKVRTRTHQAPSARGYQSFVTLLEHGSGYDGRFLHDLADDIRAAEDPKKHGDPDIWDLDKGFSGKDDDDWFANDPLDGTLGLMSKDPDTATSYFDPRTQEGKDRLHYLRVDRDWNLVNTFDFTRGNDTNPIIESSDQEDADNRVGYGAALEAAMTGHAPDSETPQSFSPNQGQRAVFEEVVNSYASQTETDQAAMPQNIRQNMANAVAYYPEDVNRLLGERGNTYAHFHEHPHRNISSTSMIQFIRAAGEDGQAFRTIHDSQLAQVIDRVSGLEYEDFTGEGPPNNKADLIVKDSGKTMGTLDKIRADILTDERDEKIDKNNWAQLYAYHGIAAPVSRIPIFGADLDRATYFATRDAAEDANAAIMEKSHKQIIEHYKRNGFPKLEEIITKRADQLGVKDEDLYGDEGRGSNLLSDAGTSYSAGLSITDPPMGN